MLIRRVFIFNCVMGNLGWDKIGKDNFVYYLFYVNDFIGFNLVG